MASYFARPCTVRIEFNPAHHSVSALRRRPLIWIGFLPALIARYRVLPGRLTSLAPATSIGGFFGFYIWPIFGVSGTYMTWLPLVIATFIFMTDKNTRAFHEGSHYRWFAPGGGTARFGVDLN